MSGIFYALAVSSLSVIGVLMAGWASANKYSLIGGLRAAGQLIAYELPLVLAVVGVVIQAGTLNLQGIVAAQASGEIFGWGGLGNPFILTQFVGFFVFLDCGPGGTHPAPVRHARRRVGDRRRLPGRVHRIPVPAVLHGRVRHGLRLRSDRRGACSSVAGGSPASTSTSNCAQRVRARS